MGINKYNSEGYYDPTVYEALSNIEKEEKAARRVYRPLVYICSPYAGDVERNVNMARTYSRFAVRNTCIPITPHLLYPQFMDDGSPAERELALFICSPESIPSMPKAGQRKSAKFWMSIFQVWRRWTRCCGNMAWRSQKQHLRTKS